TLALAGDSNRYYTQGFEAIIKDPKFYIKDKGFFFSDSGQRKILKIHIEKQEFNCITLSPKNHIISDEIIQKGAIHGQNPKTNQQIFIENINNGTVNTAVNITLCQRKGIRCWLKLERNAIIGTRTEIVILPNQSCLPFIQDTKADRYLIKQ
ncbi:MAG: hypothetical protein EZS28_048806, partial [Streblomastix strix]